MMALAAMMLAGVLPGFGCGSGVREVSAAETSAAVLQISPATAAVEEGNTYTFAVTGFAGDVSSCAWQAADATVLQSMGGGSFLGSSVGSTNVEVACGSEKASSAAVVTAPAIAGPIKITVGGTYSGNWSSNDPKTPAVTIATDQPVTIQNSTITSKGALIFGRGTTGLQLTVTDVTGVALDPGVAGLQRGRFLDVGIVKSLTVTHNTMTGVSFGVVLGGSTVSQFSIMNNVATNMEDRASDGNGGLTTSRPDLGHFVYFNTVSAPNGGQIAWNQVMDTPGQASVEDIINLNNSRGSLSATISVHDNYLQGAFTGVAAGYTGGGITTDGPGTDVTTATGYVDIRQNQVVHTANLGIAIAAGHDISITGNRVVSCGQDAAGKWYTTNGVAFYMWNYYKTAQFYNNTISGNSGGLVMPNGAGQPVAADLWTPDASVALNNVAGPNAFTDPCLVAGVVNVQAEADELAAWNAKLGASTQTVGSRR